MNPKAQAQWTAVKTGMLVYQPFFATILLEHMDVRIGKFPHIPTAGTNDKVMWIDEDYFASLTLEQAVGLVCHEIGHAIYMHMARARRYLDLGFDGKPFVPGIWNIAGDYVINDLIVKSKAGTLPPGGLLHPKYNSDCLVDDVYREIYQQNPPPPPRGGGQGEGDGDGDSGSEAGKGQEPPEGSSAGVPNNDGYNGQRPMDTHVYDVAQTSPAEMKRVLASAVDRAKAMGRLPAEIERLVGTLIAPKVNWKERLRTIVTKIISRDATTWRSPHRRRLVSQGVYLPSYTGFGAGIVATGHDTSGSMQSPQLTAGVSETAAVLNDCRPEKVYVIACDARVHDVTEYGPDDDISAHLPPLRGGGGTSFIPVFEWLEENQVEPAILIYFTDLYGSFPDKAPPYPVIWVTDTDPEHMKPPFGEVVHIEIDPNE